jgi:hypothetical protein
MSLLTLSRSLLTLSRCCVDECGACTCLYLVFVLGICTWYLYLVFVLLKQYVLHVCVALMNVVHVRVALTLFNTWVELAVTFLNSLNKCTFSL